MVLDTEATNRESNEVVTAIAGLGDKVAKLGAQIEAIRPPEKASLFVTATRQATHVRMRIDECNIVASAATTAVITLHIGNITIDFPFGTTLGAPFALPMIVDRGVDVWITTTGSPTVTLWLTYRPE